MNLFRRSPPALDVDPQRPLEVHDADDPEYAPLREPVWNPDFGPKPRDLVDAATRGEDWTRDDFLKRTRKIPIVTTQLSAAAPEVPWTRELPATPGVYWHWPKTDDAGGLEWLVVLRSGQQLCVCQRRPDSDSIAFVNVALVGGWWSSSPLAKPEGVSLEDIPVR